MKTFIITFALLLQTAFLIAADKKINAVALYDNVKMYRQPGTSAEVIKSLRSSEQLVVIRKHNTNWSIVEADGQVGYVLTSELTKTTIAPKLARALTRK